MNTAHSTDALKAIEAGYCVVLRESLVKVTGSAPHAMVLGQLVYWHQHTHDPQGWFYKSAAKLSEELYGLWKEGKIRNILNDLVKAGFVQRKRDPDSTKNRFWYRVDLVQLAAKITQDTPETSTPPSSPGKEGSSPGEDNIDYGKETTSSIPLYYRMEDPAHPVRVGTPSDSVAGDQLHGQPLSVYRQAVDVAVAKNLAMAKVRYWQELPGEVTQGQTFNQVFGDAPAITWNSSEEKSLAEIVNYCAKRWPEHDSVNLVAGLIRSSFRVDGKAFQILKFWIQHSNGKPTLRPYLSLAGGGKDPAKRHLFLDELAALPAMVQVIADAALPCGSGQVEDVPAGNRQAASGTAPTEAVSSPT